MPPKATQNHQKTYQNDPPEGNTRFHDFAIPSIRKPLFSGLERTKNHQKSSKNAFQNTAQKNINILAVFSSLLTPLGTSWGALGRPFSLKKLRARQSRALLDASECVLPRCLCRKPLWDPSGHHFGSSFGIFWRFCSTVCAFSRKLADSTALSRFALARTLYCPLK